MTDRKTTPTPASDKRGVLPDGVRGTTRDTAATVPQDEHAGYSDPARPDARTPDNKSDPKR